MARTDADIACQVDELDLTLFKTIESQSSNGDRRSWLAIQRAVRKPDGYAYLEIGSHLGGSLQQHLVDPACRHITSIDKRPTHVPDDRKSDGDSYAYDGNSTQRMLANLRQLQPDLSKILTIDDDAGTIDPSTVSEPVDFCFIDGEHTLSAVLSDFNFCLRVCKSNAAICFHDDVVIAPAIERIVKLLQRERIPFKAVKLEGDTFGILLRDSPAIDDPFVRSHGVDGMRWLKKRSFRRTVQGLVPQPLRPAGSWIADRLGCRTVR